MIITVGPSGRDYTSLAAAEAAEQTDLVSLGEGVEFVCDAFADAGPVTIAGWTSDATRYVTVRAATGAEPKLPDYETDCYRLSNTGNVLEATQDYTRVERIVTILADGAGSFRYGIRVGSTGRIVGCVSVIEDESSHSAFFTSGAGHVRNCIGIGNTSANCNGIYHEGGATAAWYSNTMARCANGYFREGGTVLAKNCLATACTTDFGGSYDGSSDYNASEDTTAPGSNSRVSQTFTFAGTGDYHLAAGDGGARGFGVSLAADGSFPFSDDVDAETRTGSWDIGADQYVAGGGGATLTADVGTFALTGHAAALTVQRRLTAAVGTFALTGHAAGLAAARRLTAAVGTFALTGHDAALRAARRLVAAEGTFALTGHDALFTRGTALTADAGAFTLTGHDAALRAARQLLAETGAFTLTGHAADLRIGLSLVAETGAFVLTGHAAALVAARLLTAEAGTFTLTGQAAGLAAGRRLTAEAGSFTLTGHDATLLAARILAAAVGTFTLTGHDAAITYSGFVPGVPGRHPLRVSFTLLGKSVAFTPMAKRAAFTLLTKSVDLEA